MIFQTINPVAFEIFGLSIRWYAIIIISGVMLATYLSNKEAIRKQFPEEFISDLLFYLLPISIIGARIYYVLFSLDYYVNNPIDIIKIWEGGIAIYGGLLAGLGVIIWYSRKFRVTPWIVVDIIAPTVLLAQAIGRWGNFVNQEAYGEIVSRSFLESLHLPNFIIEQMYINGSYYHPTFLYESVLSIIGFVVLISIRKYYKGLLVGELTLGYVIWYGIERFVVEGMRTDSLYLGVLRVSQALSLVLLLGAIVLFVYRRRQGQMLYKSFNYGVRRGDEG